MIISHFSEKMSNTQKIEYKQLNKLINNDCSIEHQ